ncbi:RNA-directed DNA polymerase [Bordetella trematum]|uniref:RNA-directed DNA polymerase n=1 Tax=Bordetella trematum TaxID=123899 RepID=UPI0013FD7794|nr:RNA-directed DNA polymerase [Bordetella trematum]
MITLQDLSLAYRKAKVDLYYTSHPDLGMIADYERKLHKNLQALLGKIDGADEEWISSKGFLGEWTLAAKGLGCVAGDGDKKKFPPASNGCLIYSSPKDEWDAACANLAEGTEVQAEFRLMAQPSMDFHVLSALWMLQVGCHYDKKLDDCAYGSRLRRTAKGEFNQYSLGSLKPYLKPFRDWRDGGIRAMRSALEAKKSIVALTADVSSFYHELNPKFMLDESFNQLLELPEDLAQPELKKLHLLFIHALQAWAKQTPLKKGLPVGLPASAVVANMALFELDRVIQEQIAPLYYGRYVDDIILVMDGGKQFHSTSDVWEWIFSRSRSLLAWVDGKQKKKVQFKPDYLTKSRIQFDNGKNKIFRLEGPTGLAMIGSIERNIHERASEWRALPNLPHAAEQIGTDLVAATQQDGDFADNLRKADSLAMRRASFAIKLRDFEAYERDLPPTQWAQHRHAFLDAFIQHVLVLPHFFELETYLIRVVRLAVACEDFKHLGQIIKAVRKLVAQVHDNCKPKIKSASKKIKETDDTLVARWEAQLLRAIRQGIIAAMPPKLSTQGKADWHEHIVKPEFDTGILGSLSSIHARHARWFACDLAHLPLRFAGMFASMVDQRGIPKGGKFLPKDASTMLLPDDIELGIRVLAHWIGFKERIPSGLRFATRPFNLSELFIIAPKACETCNQDELAWVVRALRGFTPDEKMPRWNDGEDRLLIPDGKAPARHAIAVSSWQTSMKSWIASVSDMEDPLGRDRYERLTRLLNGVISHPKGTRYLILPELAMPARWFMRFAYKLHGRGISLITGIEYLHARKASKARVRNQVWAALSHDGLGFPSLMVYRQDKQRPALHEELELQRIAGLKMKPGKRWDTPPIIQHGDFRFALLVCSELTNISYRAALRGKVDALFVPEWNQDTETFNALVESAALDVHAYIIQCNDRQYGDSRIRAPFKDSWKRDVLRVKGGVTDYCVIGGIDVQALRQFQSSHRSPGKPFKPVPDGFEIDFGRKVLPAGEAE